MAPSEPDHHLLCSKHKLNRAPDVGCTSESEHRRCKKRPFGHGVKTKGCLRDQSVSPSSSAFSQQPSIGSACSSAQNRGAMTAQFYDPQSQVCLLLIWAFTEVGSQHWGQRSTLIGPLDEECHGDELWRVKTHPSSQADDGNLGKGVSGWLQVLSFRWLSPLGRGTESCQYLVVVEIRWYLRIEFKQFISLFWIYTSYFTMQM